MATCCQPDKAHLRAYRQTDAFGLRNSLLRRQGSARRSPAVVMVSSGQMTRIGHGRCRDCGAQRVVSGVIAVSAPTAGACGLSRYLRWLAVSMSVPRTWPPSSPSGVGRAARASDNCLARGHSPHTRPRAFARWWEPLSGTARLMLTWLGRGGRPLPRTCPGRFTCPASRTCTSTASSTGEVAVIGA
jgi:hypothetical protein